LVEINQGTIQRSQDHKRHGLVDPSVAFLLRVADQGAK
jgi:hypothetical protein